MNAFLRLALFVILMALAPSSVVAHALLLSTEPVDNALLDAVPKTVTLRFNEPVNPLLFTLIGPGGVATELVVSGGADMLVQLPPELATGTHVMSWRVVSSDGHPISGSLVFSVGQVTGDVREATTDLVVAAALWTGKALFFIAMFVGIGGAVFSSVATLPAGARRVVTALSVLGPIIAVLSLGLHGLDALGLGLSSFLDGRIWAAGMSTTYAFTVVVATAAFLVALGALRRPAGRMAGGLALVAGALAAAALALSGHASAAAPQWVTRPAVFLHIAGILFWLGALLPLWQLLRERSEEAGRALTAFSRKIPYAVAPLVASGVVLAVVQMGWPGPHWVSPYGFILAAKLGLLLVLFALALMNRHWLTEPALAGDTTARARLRRSIGAETLLVLIILGLVAGWRFTPPPRAVAEAAAAALAAEPRSIHMMDTEIMATVVLTPGRTGPMTAAIAVTDADGEVREAQSVAIILSAPDFGIEPIRREAKAGAGDWRVDGLAIPVPGKWQIAVEVRLGRFDLRRLESEIAIRE